MKLVSPPTPAQYLLTYLHPPPRAATDVKVSTGSAGHNGVGVVSVPRKVVGRGRSQPAGAHDGAVAALVGTMWWGRARVVCLLAFLRGFVPLSVLCVFV